ncbi:MAG: DNA mismatch repair endonuclease MutL [Oscillospiraceae bacterium]|nr:DNA mismatch repair endonuclease MutL [Oscillospiraceae bacterium]
MRCKAYTVAFEKNNGGKMGKINLLSKETSELIAAGEVIERPSSVIKELIENSIDSGADNITVEIKNGGISYIRVTDNGCGIMPDDVPTAFLRHATSKISSKNDLNSICTLGFRGEALASICAVSRVEVLTKTPGSLYGTHYIIEGSEEKINEQSGCPEGTTIIIRDIFYNVPARLKFLKKDVAEGNAIADIAGKIAVSHPEISFKFIRNNRQDFLTPGDGELYSSVYSIMGRSFAESLIPVEYKLNGVEIKGFTVKPIFGRPKRNFQYFFVNGRYVKAFTCTLALEEAYQNCIMEGKFPACVLLIKVSPEILDVNVHPAKIEVRFTDDRVIHDGIYFSVKNAILSDSEPMEMEIKRTVPDYTRPLPESFNTGKQLTFAINEVPNKSYNTPVYGSAMPVQREENRNWSDYYSGKNNNLHFTANQDVPVTINVEYSNPQSEQFQTEVPYTFEGSGSGDDILDSFEDTEPHTENYKYITFPEQSAAQDIVEKPEKEIFFRVIGEAFKDYIITEVDEEIIFIDKHAAHERILFERLKSGQQQLQCQMMLVPIDVMLSNEEFDALTQNKRTAFELGFSFTERRGTSVRVDGIPAILDGCDVSDLVIELAHNFSVNKNNPMPVILDDMYHTFACKAAIKANDDNSLKELSSIVRTLLENESIRYCPHGRPVMFKISKYELEKQFRRIV